MNDQKFLERIDELKKNGYSEKEIADFFGLSIVGLRLKKSNELYRRRMERRKEALEYKESGMSVADIAAKMNLNESSVRLLLDDEAQKQIDARREKYIKQLE